MLSSHLDEVHPTLAGNPAANNPVIAGMGEDAPSAPLPATVPAPVPAVSPKVVNLLIVGGIALCLFLYLRSQHGTK